MKFFPSLSTLRRFLLFMHYIIYLVLLQNICVLNLYAISPQIEKSKKITLSKFEQKGDSLYVKFTFDLNSVEIKSKHKMLYTPTLTSISQSIQLPQITLQGRNNYKNTQRKLFLNSSDHANSTENVYMSVNSFGTETKIVYYKHTISYEPWMKYARLELESELLCCCCELRGRSKYLLSDLARLELTPVLFYLKETADVDTINSVVAKLIESHPFVAHLSSYEESIKMIGVRKDKNVLRLYFPFDESEIDKNYSTNREVLQQIESAVSMITNSNIINVIKILVIGFTSIEGTYGYNKILAQKRAESIRNHLQSEISLSDSIFTIYNGIENWIGLRELVLESDIKERSKILDIIDNVPITSGREEQLIALNNGSSYRYLKEHFFTKLRNDYIKIYFDIDTDSVAQRINLAISDINAKRYTRALTTLYTVASDNRSDPAFGVCYMMLGDFEKAKEYLQKAADRGDANAQANLEQIQRVEKE